MKILKIIWKIIVGFVIIFSMLSIMAIGLYVIFEQAKEFGTYGTKQFWFVGTVTVFSATSLWLHFLELIGLLKRK